MKLSAILFCFLAVSRSAASDASADDIQKVGPGITPPKLIHKIEPEYSYEARNAQVQGTALYDIVIDERGGVSEISVISPLGFGLDERGEQALRKWRFKPAEKDGKPVKVRANVEMNFRFPHLWYNAKAERHRTDFNAAIRRLNSKDPKSIEDARKTIVELAEHKYVPAVYLLSVWKRKGTLGPADPAEGLKLLHYAAEKHHGSAMYEVGKMHLEGTDAPLDPEKGHEMLRDAAVLGSIQAQFYLGGLYEAGKGVATDVDKARRYFRLCAAGGEPACQYRLAQLLLKSPARLEREYVQAIAWLQLASESGLEPARKALERELPKLSPEQTEWASKLKSQLITK